MRSLGWCWCLIIYVSGSVICNEGSNARIGEPFELSEDSGNDLPLIATDQSTPNSTNRNDKIVGGTKAKKGEFPWVVGIWRLKAFRPFCGGSLLNNR